MKKITVRERSHGRKTRMNAKTTYRTPSGEWIAEVDGKEFSQACAYVCQGVNNCSCEELDVQLDVDDDGTRYKVVSN